MFKEMVFTKLNNFTILILKSDDRIEKNLYILDHIDPY